VATVKLYGGTDLSCRPLVAMTLVSFALQWNACLGEKNDCRYGDGEVQ
jgi:hypothetical protein